MVAILTMVNYAYAAIIMLVMVAALLEYYGVCLNMVLAEIIMLVWYCFGSGLYGDYGAILVVIIMAIIMLSRLCFPGYGWSIWFLFPVQMLCFPSRYGTLFVYGR